MTTSTSRNSLCHSCNTRGRGHSAALANTQGHLISPRLLHYVSTYCRVGQGLLLSVTIIDPYFGTEDAIIGMVSLDFDAILCRKPLKSIFALDGICY